MSGSLTSVAVVSLLAFCLLHTVWAVSKGTQGTFTITTHVSNVKYSGTIDLYYIIVQFESGKIWEKSIRITPLTGMYSDTTYDFDTDATYYGNNDRIKYVVLYKNAGADDFFPDYFIINGPEPCDRYECNWKKACARNGGGSDKYMDCFLEQSDAVQVPCELANANPECAEWYV